MSITAKNKRLSKKTGPPVHDDLVQRDFSATRPDELWLTDITEHWTNEGKVYTCVIEDVFSKRFVRELKANKIIGSMGRVGACRNSAAMESFFSLLQKNIFDTKR